MPTSVGVPISLTYSASATNTSRSATVDRRPRQPQQAELPWRKDPAHAAMMSSWTLMSSSTGGSARWSGRDPVGFEPLCDPEDVHYEDPLTPEPLESVDAGSPRTRSACGAGSPTRASRGPARGDGGRYVAAPMKVLATHTARSTASPHHRFMIVHGVADRQLREERMHRIRVFFDLYDAACSSACCRGRGPWARRRC